MIYLVVLVADCTVTAMNMCGLPDCTGACLEAHVEAKFFVSHSAFLSPGCI